MKKQEIPFHAFSSNMHHLWSRQWLLLCCGDFEKKHYDAMTVGWGSFGVMWNKPFVQVVVRTTRYTFEFMNQYRDFTLSAFSEDKRPALQLLGTRSGRDGDKIGESGLTPVASKLVRSPGFEEAVLSIECQMLYWQDMEPEQFLDDSIHKLYNNDYHRIFFGEIKRITQCME